MPHPPILSPTAISLITRYSIPIALVLTGCLLVLTGCSESASTAAPGNERAHRSGVLTTAHGNYVFTPTICAVYRDEGLDDIEISGPGIAPDGEVFYFSLSSTAEALSLGLGVDGPFATSERTISAGRWASEPYRLTTNGKQFAASDLVLVDEQGRRIEGSASLAIDCGAP